MGTRCIAGSILASANSPLLPLPLPPLPLSLHTGINVGLGYAVLHSYDEVGLWKEPPMGSDPYPSAAFTDLILTTILIAFLTSLISTKGIREAMKKGQTVPVENAALKRGQYKCMPVRLHGTCTRSFFLAAWACVFVCFPAIAIMEIVCVAGGMHGAHATCSMEKTTYIYVKAAFAGVCAWMIYPVLLLGVLNVETLPPLDLTFFVQNQKERWQKQQQEAATKIPPPPPQM